MTAEIELAQLARQYSKEAIAALVMAIRDATDLRIKVTAALGLLDRGFGRPAQAQLPQPEISLEDVNRMIAYLEQRVAAGSGSPDPTTSRTSPAETDRDAR